MFLGFLQLLFRALGFDEVFVAKCLLSTRKGLLEGCSQTFNVFLQRLDPGQSLLLRFPPGLQLIGRFFSFCNLTLQLLQTFFALFAGLLFQSRSFDLHASQTASRFIDLHRHRVDFHAEPTGRFVHKVDRFVWQKAIADIAI